MKKIILASVFLVIFFIVALSFFWSDISDNVTGTTMSSIRTCADSDTGKVYNITGNVTICRLGKCEAYVDTCNNKTGRINEKYCTRTNYVGQKSYKCPRGCMNGACI